MFCSVYVDNDFVSEVCYGQTMLCVVHVENKILSKANHDQTIFCVVHVNGGVFAKVSQGQTTGTMRSSSRSIMTLKKKLLEVR